MFPDNILTLTVPADGELGHVLEQQATQTVLNSQCPSSPTVCAGSSREITSLRKSTEGNDRVLFSEKTRASVEPVATAEINKRVKKSGAINKNSDKKELSAKVAKAKKTLQDDQRMVNKKFAEKIVDLEPGYGCKSCKFKTGLLLLAKTHALSCGAKKRKGGKGQRRERTLQK